MEHKAEADSNAGSPPKEPEHAHPTHEAKEHETKAEDRKVAVDAIKKQPEAPVHEEKEEPNVKEEEERKEQKEGEGPEVTKEEEKHPGKGRGKAENYVMPTTFEVEIHLEDNQVTDKIKHNTIDKDCKRRS
jgi:hypothetical protein